MPSHPAVILERSGLVCPGCRYPIDGLSQDRCPECGADFDRSKIERSSGKMLWRIARLAPPRWMLMAYAACAVPSFLMLCSVNGAVADHCAVLLVFVVVFPAMTWVAFFGLHLLARMLILTSRRRQPRWAWRWLVFPAIVLCCSAIQRSGVIWHARWVMAKPSLARLVGNPAAEPGWYGGFQIVNIWRHTDGLVELELGFPDRFYSDGPAKIIYDPTGPRSFPGVPYLYCNDLGGGWRAWVDPT